MHGHCHPKIDAAVHAQLDRIAHTTLLGLANVPSIRLATQLVAITPPHTARRLNNGSPYWITIDQRKSDELEKWVQESTRITSR